MSELLTSSRPTEQFDPSKVEWPRLLEEALTMPGDIGNTYNRFYNYSLGNRTALWMQGVTEPVATFKKWQELGRQVQRGSKARFILRPIMFSDEDEQGKKVQRVKGFKWAKALFPLSETEGEELPPYEPPSWSRERALASLAITEVAFEHYDGNVAGYSQGHELAVNPVAPYPFKTLVHEMGHIALGHTQPEAHSEYQTHRGLKEFGAEGTAYLVMNELDSLDQMDASASRAYIQGWLRGERPDDAAIKEVFSATDKILRAGRSTSESGDE